MENTNLRPRGRFVVAFATALLMLAALAGIPASSAMSLTDDAPAAAPAAPAAEPAAPVAEASAASQLVEPPRPAREMVTLHLYGVNTLETLDITVPLDGMVDPETGEILERFFRCKRTGRHKPLSPGVLALLADVGKKFPGKTIEMVSGYRSPPYGVRHSKHFKGNAIDLRVRGTRLTKVRDAIWRDHVGVGVGWYAEQEFIHIDSRPGEKDMAWTAKHEGAPYRYHPYWSEKARANPLVAAR